MAQSIRQSPGYYAIQWSDITNSTTNALAVGVGIILVIIALLALTRGATQPVVKVVQPTQQIVKRITRRKK